MSSSPDLYTLIEKIDSELLEVVHASGAANIDETVTQEKLTKYVLVAVGALHLAVAIEDLSEVGPLPTITFLPNLPLWIQGIVNIRGEIISVIDLAGFLRLSDQAAGCVGNRFVVVQYGKQKIGIRLDRIVGTVSRTDADTKPLHSSNNNSMDTSFFPAGLLVDNTLYHIVNVRRFLTAPRLIDFRNNE